MRAIRQLAFSTDRKLLKGALHCHSTRSDGEDPPSQVLKSYHQKGFDFVALTDHNVYNRTNDAPETGLTILPATEVDVDFASGVGCLHTVLIGKTTGEGQGYEQDQRFPSFLIERQEDFQPALDKHHAAGNLSILCHPGWSNIYTRQYERLKGNFALEVWNTGSALDCHMDMNNERDWDELLMQGQRIFAVATDDAHRVADCGYGWVRVNAENKVESIAAALEKGAFYSSCGPEIYDFCMDGDTACVSCSPCRSISFCRSGSPYKVVRDKDRLITEATFLVPPGYRYIRITVEDEFGRMAWTNPIFKDER